MAAQSRLTTPPPDQPRYRSRHRGEEHKPNDRPPTTRPRIPHLLITLLLASIATCAGIGLAIRNDATPGAIAATAIAAILHAVLTTRYHLHNGHLQLRAGFTTRANLHCQDIATATQIRFINRVPG